MTHDPLTSWVNDQVWCLFGTRSSPTSSKSFCQNRWIFLQTCLPLNTTSVVLNCSCSYYGHFYGKIMFWILNHQIWEYELYFQTSSSGKVFEGAVEVRWWCFGWFFGQHWGTKKHMKRDVSANNSELRCLTVDTAWCWEEYVLKSMCSQRAKSESSNFYWSCEATVLLSWWKHEILQRCFAEIRVLFQVLNPWI